MAIATSSRYDGVQKKRKRHEDMFQFIKTIVAGDDPNVLNGKPSPDIYLEAARRLNVHPKECLVFEDALSRREYFLDSFDNSHAHIARKSFEPRTISFL